MTQIERTLPVAPHVRIECGDHVLEIDPNDVESFDFSTPQGGFDLHADFKDGRHPTWKEKE